MKFLCNKSDLIEAVSIVQKAIKTNTTIQILDGILIQCEFNKIKLTGYDLETGIEADLVGEVLEEGSIVINSKYFGDIIKKLPEEMTTISTDDRNTVSIISGVSNTNIKGNPADSYPKIPIIENSNKITISQKMLKNMIDKTIFAVCKDEARASLTGCCLESDGSVVTMVAIDGFRMALRKEEAGEQFPEMSYIIPGKALSEAAKIFDGDDENKEVIIYSSSNHLLFDVGNVRIVSRLIQGPFVNYNSIIRKNPTTVMKIDRKSLYDAIERAALIIMTDERRCPVQLKMVDSNTLMIMSNAEAGAHKESIDVEVDGELVDIDFNYKYFLEVLKNIDEDIIRVEFNGPQGPCIIVPTEGNSFVYLILPIRR